MITEAPPGVGGIWVDLSVPNYHFGRGPCLETKEDYLVSRPGLSVDICMNVHQMGDSFDILERGESDTSTLYMVRGCGRTVDYLIAGSGAVDALEAVFVRSYATTIVIHAATPPPPAKSRAHKT